MNDVILSLILLAILIVLLVGGLFLLIKGAIDLARMYTHTHRPATASVHPNDTSNEVKPVERAA